MGDKQCILGEDSYDEDKVCVKLTRKAKKLLDKDGEQNFSYK